MKKSENISVFEVLNSFIVGKIAAEEVSEYLNSNPRARYYFSFFNISHLLLNSPRIVYLLNKHLNHVYLNNIFSKDNTQELKTIESILAPFNKNELIDSKQIFRQGKTINEKNKIALDNYITLKAMEFYFGKELDENELIFLKLLFDYNIIVDKELKSIIDGIKEYLQNADNKKRNIKKLLKRYTSSEKDVDSFLETINRIKTEYRYEESSIDNYCELCPLKKLNLPRVDKEIFNPQNKESIDVFIIGLNPGKDEVEQNKPFIGKSGQILRKYINEYLVKNGISYLITNVIKCHTDNETELKDILSRQQIELADIKCNYFVDYIRQYKPRYILCFGKTTERILKTRLVENELNNINIVYLKHPSYYIRKGLDYPAIEEYNNVFQNIVDELLTDSGKQDINRKNNTENNDVKNRITEINDIDEIPQDRLLVDIRVLEKQNRYLILTTDSSGTKYYYLMPFKTEFYYNENGADSPRYNPHVIKYKMLKKLEIDDYQEYEKLKNYLRREYRKYFEI